MFTLFSDSKTVQVDNHKLRVVTALPHWINQIFLFYSKRDVPVFSWLFDYRNLMFFYPFLMKVLSYKIRKYHPNYVVISSFAIAKNITPIS